MKRKILTLATLIILVFSGCGSGKKEGAHSDKPKELTMGYVDGWAEGVAMTYLVKDILSREGYSVEVKSAAVDLIFASLANGDTDVFMDVWLPATHKEKVAKFKEKIEKLGVNYANARIGLVVPAYVEINSIEELNAHKEDFDGKIIGIEKGAGLTAKTEAAIKAYNLDFEQLNSSSVAMVTLLKKAIDEGEPIVVAGWAPHWKFGRFDLKFLEDPKGVYGETESIETFARKGFAADDKFAADFFSRFELNDAQMANLLAKMEEGEEKEAIAKTWVDNNQDLVKTWLGNNNSAKNKGNM